MFFHTKTTDNAKPAIVITFESMEPSEISYIKDIGDGHIEFNACLQSAEIINRNNKFYPAPVLTEALQQPRLQELVKRKVWFGEISHPYQRKDFQRSVDVLPERVSHRVCDIPTLKGNLFCSRIETVDPMGKTMASWCKRGSVMGFSMRGLTPYEVTKTSPIVHKVVRSPMVILCYDAVWYNSHPEATMQTSTIESNFLEFASLKKTEEIEMTFNDVAKYIATESKNFKIFTEELGIKLDTSKTVKAANVKNSVDVVLEDGRLARLRVENDIFLQIAESLKG